MERGSEPLTMDFERKVEGERTRLVHGQARVVRGVDLRHLKEFQISSSGAQVKVGVVLVQRHVILEKKLHSHSFREDRKE